MTHSYLSVLLSIIFLFTSCMVDEIQAHKGIAVAQIVSGEPGYRGGFSFNYVFYVDSKKYSGHNPTKVSETNMSSFLNKSFPVVYSTINPEKNIILITKSHFNDWGVQFPDSLKWVDEKYQF